MKKIAHLVIFIGIILSSYSVVFAENVKFEISQDNITSNGTINVKVLIKNNPGISAF